MISKWLCRWFGHVEFGPYYGMPQDHCVRCGAPTRFNRNQK